MLMLEHVLSKHEFLVGGPYPGGTTRYDNATSFRNISVDSMTAEPVNRYQCAVDYSSLPAFLNIDYTDFFILQSVSNM